MCDEDGWDKERTRAHHREEGCDSRTANALEEHVDGNGEGKEEHTDHCVAECRDSYGGVGSSLLKKPHHRLREDAADEREQRDKTSPKGGGKEQSALDTGIFLCLVIEGGNRLKALTDSKSHEHNERGEAVGDTHARHHHVSVRAHQGIEHTARD